MINALFLGELTRITVFCVEKHKSLFDAALQISSSLLQRSGIVGMKQLVELYSFFASNN
jgi:hypothetical protein